VVRGLEAAALGSARRVLAVNDGVAQRAAALAGRHDRIDVVGNGIDTEVFCPAGERRGSGPMAVYAGTTSEWQGADIFVRAMPAVIAALPDARLVFLGQGSAWSGLQRLAASFGLNSVDFLGPVPPAEAAAWLRSAALGLVSLHPGSGYDFAFPTKVYATVATGTPVLYVGPGPAAAVIRGAGLGLTADYTEEEVAAAMIEALRTPVAADRRQAIAAWATQNVSLQIAAGKAADSVHRVGRPQQGGIR
jgi:glycosyltransferase involved in cell wall biosynthesis